MLSEGEKNSHSPDSFGEYYSAIDTKKVLHKALGITAVPHAILVDPEGIVRWEGYPLLKGHELTAEMIEEIIKEYKKK